MNTLAMSPLPERIAPAWRHKLLAFTSLLALVVVFGLASPNFLETDNLISILQATAVNGVLAVACTFVIVTGGIDLSVGTLMSLCAVIGAVVMAQLGLPVGIGMLAAVAAGALCGWASGAIVAKLGVAPFVATLGMMMAFKGAALLLAGARPVYLHDVPGIGAIAQDSWIGLLMPALPLPNSVLVLLIAALLGSVLLKQTLLGRYAVAMGSNEEAARLSGIAVARWKMAVYALSGALCGVAGLLMASRLNSAQPALGQGYELDAIAAVVIGGTSLSGGKASMLGTLIGALIISVLANGLRLLSIAQEWQIVATGLILILAVYADQLRHRRT
jgi:ribose transport system permease protein